MSCSGEALDGEGVGANDGRSGVPQVVLPVWMDTYDFARRAEILGIGRWGNRLAGKLCESGELGAVLVDVIAGERSSAFAHKAKELAELCRKSGGGRVVAARHILAETMDNVAYQVHSEKQSGIPLNVNK